MFQRRTTGFLALVVLAVLFAASDATHLGAAKPAPSSPNWPCQITFRDAPTDAIQSDPGGGAFRDAQNGVQCYVNRYVGAGNFGNLFVNVAPTSPRYLWMPGQQAVGDIIVRTGYEEFQNRQPGYFEITGIDTATSVNTTYRRRVRVGVGYGQFDGGEFWGDSLATDPLTVGSSSAWVIPTTACSWQVTWDPGLAAATGEAGIVALREGTGRRRTRTGNFSLAFSATVTVTGGKAGCLGT